LEVPEPIGRLVFHISAYAEAAETPIERGRLVGGKASADSCTLMRPRLAAAWGITIDQDTAKARR